MTPKLLADENQPPSSQYDIVWNSPSKNAAGSMPIGNGDIGANVWVEENGDLLFYISKSDAWGDNGRLLKVGKIRVSCQPQLFTPGDQFSQQLDLNMGCITVRSTSQDIDLQLSVWIDANHPTIHIEQNSSIPISMTAQIELWRNTRQEYTRATVSDLQEKRSEANQLAKKVWIEPDTIVKDLNDQIAWYHHNIKSDGFTMSNRLQGLSEYFPTDPILHRTFGGLVTGKGAQRINDTTLRTQSSKHGHLEVTLLTTHEITPDQWLKKTQSLTKKTQTTSLPERRSAHQAWWQQFWSRSWIHITGNQEKKPTLIPDNQHNTLIGIDQHGSHRFKGEIARLSLIKKTLTKNQISFLAKGRRENKLSLPDISSSHHQNKTTRINQEAIGNKLTAPLTIEAWIKTTGEAGRILDKITPGDSDGLLLDTHLGNGLRLIVGEMTIAKANCLTSGQWHHIAATIDDKESTVKLYLDGKIIAAQSKEQLNDAALVSRSYALQRYIDACAGRGKHPIKFNGSLFTVPHKGDPDYRRWGPGYWWQNTRLPYLSMCASGDYDLLQPLFKMYAEDCFKLNQYRTKKYLGHGGAFFAECTYFWGATFTQTYGWTPFEERTDKLQESEWHKWEWVAGPELVFMMLDYYDHTQDVLFLQEKILPVALEVVRFFDQHYRTDSSGELVMHPSMACETWWDCTNPMPELAGLHSITQRLLALSKNKLTDEQRQLLSNFKEKLAPLPTRKIKGERAFAPATKFAAKRNVENPELYAVFPFRLCSLEKENVALGIAALNHRWDKGAFGWRQDDIFMTYLGLREQARSNLVQRCQNYDKNCRFPAFWGPNYDWTPDQDHGGIMMKTVQSMIMQSDPYSRKIHLNPALPKDWSCEFKLHAPYNTIVEGVIRQGKVENLKVTPASRLKDVIKH